MIIEGTDVDSDQDTQNAESEKDTRNDVFDESTPIKSAERVEEVEFTLDDVPEHLRPTSIIFEVIGQMENLKEDILTHQEKDDDLLNCIKQLNRPPGFADKIYTCSHTLDALVR